MGIGVAKSRVYKESKEGFQYNLFIRGLIGHMPIPLVNTVNRVSDFFTFSHFTLIWDFCGGTL